jgi:asparagine synthase (glutamine-hydrolysing)
MCGVAGVFGYAQDAPPVDEGELRRIRDAMLARGPDGSGLWVADNRRVGLGHRRLSVIDLSDGGAQPMATPDGRHWITYNGEVYNYRELRGELEAKGFTFRSQSDTEVLLHLYADRGREMVHALRGMFAFAIWDASDQSLFLARDPFGIKPLYYADDGQTIRFASQVKALLEGGAVNTAPEPAGSTGFLIWGAVPEPFTLYRGIRALPAGAHLTVRRDNKPAIDIYFCIRDELVRAQGRSPSRRARNDVLDEALLDSVRHHLISDVPVGVFLSSGLDSTLVTALASDEVKRPLHAITLGFREYRGTDNDEVPLAEAVAARYGIRHETSFVSREDFESEFDNILAHMDQPSIDGVNTYFIGRAAARAGLKVTLSGLGGDELFGGYPSFRHVPWLAQSLRFMKWLPMLGRTVRLLSAPLLRSVTSTKFASLLEYGGSYPGAYLLRRALLMPWELNEILDPATVDIGLSRLNLQGNLEATVQELRGSRARVAALELSWYMRNQLLRDADWAGMAHSVEIRTPLVDVCLFRALAPLLVGTDPPGKLDAVAMLERSLPKSFLHRPKTGFGTPVREWTAARELPPARQRGLRGWALRVLPPQPRLFRALALVSEGFGGTGGIAKFNRDLLTAVSGMPDCAEVVALSRTAGSETGQLPPRLRFPAKAARGKLSFILEAFAQVLEGHFDLIVVAHINMSALGIALGVIARAKSILVVHGIDAWKAHRSALVRRSLPRFSRVIGVSRLTLDRLSSWSGIDANKMRLLPNCVDVGKYGLRPKAAALLRELDIEGRTVLLTVGRLANEERYKGFDEVLEALPMLARRVPDVVYVICGEGPDRPRLEAKAEKLGLRERVRFTGFIPDALKADYYSLADAYVMPSRGEGFGIVFLEAMACGIPVMGSLVDGSREALLEGELGVLVDPAVISEVAEGIARTLSRAKGVPSRLDHFSLGRYQERATTIVREVVVPKL